MDKRTCEVLLSWLKGESGAVEGERVAVFTFGDHGYLGAFEGREFIRRYHVEGGKIRQSSMKGSTAIEDTFSLRCGGVIKQLVQTGVLKQIRYPRQHEGTGVFYQLA